MPSMALEELNDKLHGRDVHLDRTRARDVFRPDENAVAEESVSQFQQTERWSEDSLPPRVNISETVQSMTYPLGEQGKKRRKVVAMILGGIAVLLLVGGMLMKLRTGIFSEENVILALTGPAEIKSAESVEFDFQYTNDNWMDVKQAVVVFEYPDSFRPDAMAGLDVKKSRAEYSIGDILSQTKGTVTLSGKFFGTRNDQTKIYATLRYSPSAFSSFYEKRVEHGVALVSAPLLFEINAPFELASDQEIQYEVRYRNLGESTTSNLRVRLEYPTEFTFIEAEPKPEGGNLWDVGALAPQEEGRIFVKGRLIGGYDEQKLVQGGIGIVQGDGTFLAYTENSRKTKMVASPFAIYQTVNGSADASVNPGETLRYEIEYRNEGNVGIRDAIISMSLDSPYLDFKTLQFGGAGFKGAYNQSQKIIFWKASDMPALRRVEPGQSGKVSFSVKVFSDLGKRFPQVRNPIIQSVAKIDSPDIPSLLGVTKIIASTTLSMKVNSQVTNSFEGWYYDATIPNTGPIPPIVGQETTYTFRLSFSNSLNEVKDARVSIMLPSGIRHTGKKGPDSESMTYNERTNELVWNIGTFAPESTRELLFQVGVTPSISDAGAKVLLVSRAVFTGKDSFTKKDIRIDAGERDNEVASDTQAFVLGSQIRSE